MVAAFDSTSVRPLRLESITLEHYRNIGSLKFSPGPRFNVISGPNGAGKSNLLEAIYYVSALKSFRHSRTEDVISQHQAACRIAARLSGDVLAADVVISLSRTEPRRVRRNDKRPTSAAQYKTCVPGVIFHPGDIELPSGSPELRRSFVDRILEQMDPTYTSALNTYKHALRSRNRLLKLETKDLASLRAYDEMLASSGEVIGISRESLIAELAVEVASAFNAISDETLDLTLTYTPSVQPNKDALLSAYAASVERDRLRGYTSRGPHADDILVAFGATPVRHFASQGQNRAIVLAIKTAELRILTRKTGKVPMLLLDDVSSELDRQRNRLFFEWLSELGAQVFLSTTHPEFIILNDGREDFSIDQGVLKAGNKGQV